MFGLDWLTGPVLGAGVGLLAGSSNKGSSQTSSASLDPRIAKYVYGDNGGGGLLTDAFNIYRQQMAQGGLNDMQRRGLDMQAQYLQSPQYTNSYQAMMNQGMGLLGGPIAGNPFTQGRGGAQRPAMPTGGYQYIPAGFPAYHPQQQTPSLGPSSQVGGAVASHGDHGDAGGSGVSGGGHGGQGIASNDAISAAFGVNAATSNPAMSALSPGLSAIGNALSGGFLDSQANAMGNAANALGALSPLSSYGINSFSDPNGNVFSFSTPAAIAALDAATFGVGGGVDGFGGVNGMAGDASGVGFGGQDGWGGFGVA